MIKVINKLVVMLIAIVGLHLGSMQAHENLLKRAHRETAEALIANLQLMYPHGDTMEDTGEEMAMSEQASSTLGEDGQQKIEDTKEKVIDFLKSSSLTDKQEALRRAEHAKEAIENFINSQKGGMPTVTEPSMPMMPEAPQAIATPSTMPQPTPEAMAGAASMPEMPSMPEASKETPSSAKATAGGPAEGMTTSPEMPKMNEMPEAPSTAIEMPAMPETPSMPTMPEAPEETPAMPAPAPATPSMPTPADITQLPTEMHEEAPAAMPTAKKAEPSLEEIIGNAAIPSMTEEPKHEEEYKGTEKFTEPTAEPITINPEPTAAETTAPQAATPAEDEPLALAPEEEHANG